jgi:FkbH-like protein
MKRPQTIAIAATFTAEPVEESLDFWMHTLDIPCEIVFAPYNQVFQQLLDPTSLQSQNQHGLNVVLVRLEDWGRFDHTANAESGRDILPLTVLQEKMAQTVHDFVAAVKTAAGRASVPYLVCLCPASPTAQADAECQALFAAMETQLTTALTKVGGVYLASAVDLMALYHVNTYYDAYTDTLGHVPYTPLGFTALGTLVARKLYAIQSAPHKVIVLDCDQTLWQGVCGEDGPLGVTIDLPRQALQQFMRAQHDVGMLLCLNSKNNEEDVFAVFDHHPEMPLSREHILSWRINWRPKSENLQALAEELKLGLDSFIFIDDNPVECMEVQANCPETLVLQLPSQVDEIPRFLRHVWAFDHLKITEEDKKRSASYRQNVQRERSRKEALSLEDFLASLKLEIRITPLTPQRLPRVSQLTYRTNQFNTTTIRRSESDIQQLCQSASWGCLTVEVSDRFGDYGLVGVVIYEITPTVLHVDSFLMSCRVLGRGVEHRILTRLGEIAQEHGCQHVDVPYIPTKKNQPALDFLNSVGARFTQTTAQGLLFHWPVDYVVALTYKASEAESILTDELADDLPSASAMAPAAVGALTKSALLSDIATGLYDAAQILAAITERKQHARPVLETTFVAPQTPVEEMVAGLWQQLLGVDRIGVHDNFFELGGHSLLVTQAVARLRETFGVNVSMNHFFVAPTVAGIAVAITEQRAGQEDNEIIAQLLEELEQEGVSPAVLGQESSSDLLNTSFVHTSGSLLTDALPQGSLRSEDGMEVECYRAAAFERFPVGDALELVYQTHNRSPRVFPSPVIDLLTRCQRFQTLDAHAQELCGALALGQEHFSATRAQLAELVDAGLLLSQRDVLQRQISSGHPAQQPSQIATIGLVTYNRLEGLQRALTSYIENSKQYGRQTDFAVADNSTDPEIRQRYRRMLQALKTRYGVHISYGGWEEKVRFANLLTTQGGIPPEVVQFALFDVEACKFNFGANRNALLLHTLGDLCFTADDDTMCRTAVSPELDADLAVTSDWDPGDYWFFPNRQTALQSVSFVDQDILAAHEQLLGWNVGSIIAAMSSQGKLTFDRVNAVLGQRLEKGDGTVLVTFNGILGDCAWGAPFGYWGGPMGCLLLDGKSHERLVQSEAAYRAICSSREILRVVPRLTLSDAAFSITTWVGLDNRTLLPPCMPVGRGQDVIFGLTVWRCLTESFFGHVPWTLLHAPVENRAFWPGEIFRSASGFDIDKLIIACVTGYAFGPAATTGADRLRAMGRYLEEVGNLPGAEFEEFLRLQAWQTTSAHIALTEEHLQTWGEAPAFWVNDVRKYLDMLRRALMRPDYCLPLDLLDGRSVEETRLLAQRLVRRFGQLLSWWPEMTAATKQLRAQGQRLALPV